MAMENTVSIAFFDPRSSIVENVFDCRLSGVILGTTSNNDTVCA